MRERKNITLLSVLNLWTVIIIITNTVVVGALFYNQAVATNRRQTLDKFQQSFFLAHQSIDAHLRDMMVASSNLLVDSELMGDINVAEKQGGFENMRLQQEIRGKLINTVNLIPGIRDIAIYKGDTVYRYNPQQGLNRMYQDRIPSEDWFLKLKNGDVKNAVVPAYKMSENVELYINAASFVTPGTKSDRGVILIIVESGSFWNIVNSADINNTSIVCLFDRNGHLLYSNKGEDAAPLQKAWQSHKKLSTGGTMNIGGINYYIVTSESGYSGWSLVSFTRASDLSKDFYAISPSLLAAVLMVLVASILVIVLVFRTIARPLRELVLAMDSAINRGFSEVSIGSRYMEIQTIGVALNNMSRQISLYIASIREKEREKRATELKLLEAQINPHFIYNTLEAIKWVALLNQAKVVAEMLSSFVGLLQISLSAGKGSIPVRFEIEQVRHYVKIMQYRYNSYVQVQFDVDPDVLNLYTIKLILQPFVENSFFHAFEDGGEGSILIGCRIEDERLMFEVRDNGVGMQETASRNRMLKGMGIHNVDERIKLYYGTEYGVEIQALPHEGTTIKIWQPIRDREVESHDTSADRG